MGQYTTNLSPQEESSFQSWVKDKKVPFDPSDKADYDMRGYWKGLQSNDPVAKQSQSKFDGRMHFPDKWKTPYHKTFSNESMYASKDAPHWVGDKLIDKNGKIVADETPKSNGDVVKVKGPDGKVYGFPKGTTKDKAVAYFKKKNISASKEQTFATGPGQSLTTSNPATIKKFQDRAKKTQYEAVHKQKPGSLLGEELINQIPNAAATGFSIAAGGKTNPVGMGMAGLGGGAGEALKQILQHAFYPEQAPQTGTEALVRISKEGATQAAIEGVGKVLGGAAFKLAQKIPHAEIKNGIPLLPSQLSGGKFAKFTEDLLANVWPSSTAFEKFGKDQTAKITKAGADIADVMGKFKGTREQLGEMIKQALSVSEKAARPEPTLAKYASAAGTVQFERDFQAWQDHFNKGFLGTIKKIGNPANIMAVITSNKFANKDVDELIGYLAEHRSAILDYSRGQILSDVINAAMTKSKEPIIKGSKMVDDSIAGNALRTELNKIGDSRLKTIYTKGEIKMIEQFTETIGRVGKAGQGWIGRFKNFAYLTYVLGFGAGGAHGAGTQAGLFYVLGKIMTDPAGAKAYENLLRTTTTQAPRGVKELYDVYKTYVDHAKREYEYEKAKAEEQYRNRHQN